MADSLTRLGSIAERRWGMFTTAQAEAAGVARKQLVRMGGVPPQNYESIYATWLALGGATDTRTESGVAPLVAGGITAAVVHEIGGFFLDGLDFIVGSRKTTRLPDVRLRIRRLSAADVIPVNGLPTLTLERTIVDLVELGTDTSLIADALSDAVRLGKIVSPTRLRSGLAALPVRQRSDAGTLAEALDRLLSTTVDGASRG